MASQQRRNLKTLTLVVSSFGRPGIQELERLEREDVSPRVSLFQRVLNSTLLDERTIASVGFMKRLVYAVLPVEAARVLEGFLRRKRYDALISWGERFAILMGLLLKYTGRRTPHVALVYWISKPKQSYLLKKASSHIDRIITWSSVQRNYALERLHLPPSKVVYVPYGIDQQFWRPMTSTQSPIVSAVGEEMRDYETLIRAMEPVNIPCRIVAKTVRIIGQYGSEWRPIEKYGPFPPHITVGTAPFKELREIYARSRFVVLPLLPSETSSGLTVLLEAMSMGKAIICTRSNAQVDVIVEGKTGLFVKGGDPSALREAIETLWKDPARAEEMGREGRKYIEAHHTLDAFVGSVRSIVEELIP
ncbi:MAG TPA: glycosyltransferase family 4 protein [Bacteroidota bacterium]|nr:glycosyltransferase family 4 protein [Bacteroidota bacterium]